ncbi:transposase [Ammoniphilus sp. YIM 78166]|uniref:IS1/IS1595 family N-terminal zinc-binding domain-containing protein n=1 Tax=Ammoniphilus sp. YIM 78166 TaxID=1644106 RepID=UPI001430C376|nr:transposase [Ammoniphilus sp. YIM 78166]
MRTILSTKYNKRPSLRQSYIRYTDAESIKTLFQKLLASKQASTIACPHCSSSHIIGHGRYRDRQRYKCKSCSRTFNDYTNTPVHRTHYPDKWIPFLKCMVQGESLRVSAICVGISYVTLFYWRHKLSRAIQLFLDYQIHTHTDGYLPVGIHPPRYVVSEMESSHFIFWIRHFNWIKEKYLGRYVSWFRFVFSRSKNVLVETMTDFLLISSSISIDQTYRTIKSVS